MPRAGIAPHTQAEPAAACAQLDMLYKGTEVRQARPAPAVERVAQDSEEQVLVAAVAPEAASGGQAEDPRQPQLSHEIPQCCS